MPPPWPASWSARQLCPSGPPSTATSPGRIQQRRQVQIGVELGEVQPKAAGTDFDRGYDCLLVAEATASYFPRFKQATLEMITAQGGIVGWSCKLEALLQA
ncbi:hypothetical protein THIX_10231 [Thiomonas sp. X19]|nr:hypothetical protein THIX_10231 [Thiomonas sp. X19]